MILEIKKYIELNPIELKEIIDLILKGDEVNPQTLPTRLSESKLIAFYKYENQIIATATIKNPLENYKTNVFDKSKSHLDSTEYPLELGYIMVDENFRKFKLASNLCKELCRIFLTEKIFATTRTDNIGMQSILKKNYFIKAGQGYTNRTNTNFLNLFIKPKIMATYHINLSRATFNNQRIYSGTVMKLSEPKPGQKNIVSFAEAIGRNSKTEAISDINSLAQDLDYVNNEIIFIPTVERLTSFADLTQKLNDLGD